MRSKLMQVKTEVVLKPSVVGDKLVTYVRIIA